MTVKKKIMYMFISNYKRFAIRKKAFFREFPCKIVIL